MRELELRYMYWDYAFEDGESDKTKEMCMETIFAIQNEEIQDNGRYIEYPRHAVEFCCQALEDRNYTQLNGRKIRDIPGDGCWRAECPFCGSSLVLTERRVKIEKRVNPEGSA